MCLPSCGGSFSGIRIHNHYRRPKFFTKNTESTRSNICGSDAFSLICHFWSWFPPCVSFLHLRSAHLSQVSALRLFYFLTKENSWNMVASPTWATVDMFLNNGFSTVSGLLLKYLFGNEATSSPTAKNGIVTALAWHPSLNMFAVAVSDDENDPNCKCSITIYDADLQRTCYSPPPTPLASLNTVSSLAADHTEARIYDGDMARLVSHFVTVSSGRQKSLLVLRCRGSSGSWMFVWGVLVDDSTSVWSADHPECGSTRIRRWVSRRLLSLDIS